MLDDDASANNHIFNTLLMKLFSSVLGNHELPLRIHSNIAHLLYLIFSFLLVMELRSPLLRLAAFAFLNLNPYMLDFFSLARGYGMVFMFILSGSYFYLKYLQNNKKKYLTISFILAALAVYSHFTSIYFYFALFFIFLVNAISIEIPGYEGIKKSISSVYTRYKSVWLITLILIVLIFPPIYKLILHHELYGHGHSGFWENTVFSVLIGLFYNVHYNWVGPTQLLLLEQIISAAMLLTTIFLLIKLREKALKKPYTSFSIIFFTAIVIESCHHLLTGSEYIASRAAIYFQILFGLAFFFWMDELSSNFGKFVRYSIELISLVLFLALGFHFYKARNFTSTSEWKYDCNTKKMVYDLKNRLHDTDKQYTIGINWLFEPTINYYITTRHLSFLKAVTREGIYNKEYDFYYIFEDQLNTPQTDSLDLVILNRYPVSKTVLAKRK
ncbi:MAG TPA: glycosyltransferase family 39 protein [Bacteroidales bacterium]|nr:glycosyltransferase family 39 protein [Bacteroidales bacterium]